MKEIVISTDAKLYGLEAVYKACYRFLESRYIRLEGDPEGKIAVYIRPKDETEKVSESAIAGEFENELLHQALRLKIAQSNGKIREYVVARALASGEGAPAAFAGEPASSQGAAPVPALDEDLEKEIEKLLAEVEREGGEDPLKIIEPHSETEDSNPTQSKP